jgi:hypothetical protein
MESGPGPGVFVQSAQLLARSPKIVVPGLVFGCAGAILDALLQPKNGSLDGNQLLTFLQAVIEVIVAILAVACTTGMAQAAWAGGTAGFADARRALRRDVLPTVLVLFGVSLAAAALAPLTLGLSYFVDIFFLLYAMPAAVAGERRGLDAVRESIDIALARLGPTILVVAAIVIISTVMSVVALSLEATPFVGPLIAAVIVQLTVTYVTLVIVGEYLLLRGEIGTVRPPDPPIR